MKLMIGSRPIIKDQLLKHLATLIVNEMIQLDQINRLTRPLTPLIYSGCSTRKKNHGKLKKLVHALAHEVGGERPLVPEPSFSIAAS